VQERIKIKQDGLIKPKVRVSNELEARLRSEIKAIEEKMEGQKRIVRRAATNEVVVSAAETELKSLHTRLATLKGNLRKVTAT
jgi:hypothetical protein